MMTLYAPNTVDFQHNGLGTLSEALRCEVTEERNGIYELELDYPITGQLYSEIKDRCIITACPSPYRDREPFEIYRISAVMDGRITCYAHHISYRLSDIPVDPFTADSAQAAMQGLETHAVVQSLFQFRTDLTTVADFNVQVPSSTRALLGGQRGSVLDVYGGEFEWEGYTVHLHRHRGKDTGVIICYGKNLTDLEQDRNVANVVTGIYPYWSSPDGDVLVTAPSKIIKASGNYDFERIRTVDFSGEWTEPPTPAQLEERAVRYVKENRIGQPRVNIRASFIRLEQAMQYESSAPAERIDLCDTVHIRFETLGIDAEAQITQIVYDCIAQKYKNVEIGDVRPNLADQVVVQQQEIQQRPTDGAMQSAITSATSWITGGKGGYVTFGRNSAGQPDEILITDKPDITAAKNVWRWNQGGLGFSGTGYDGPYKTAITQDGRIVANFIKTGTLDAGKIRVINLIADHLRSYNGPYTLDAWAAVLKLLDAGELRAKLFTSGGGEEVSQGILQLFAGDVDVDGTRLPGSLYTVLTPQTLQLGLDADGKATGTALIGTLTALQIGTPTGIHKPKWQTLTVNGKSYKFLVGE